MPLGNWRRVFLIGPYAVKVPRRERATGARCLNRWELEMWTVWRPRFGWPHLCPVVWGDRTGRVLIMRRAKPDASEAEIRDFEMGWLDSQRAPLASAEPKPKDWGHIDGRLVVCDYGYICDSEEAIQQQRAEYAAKWEWLQANR